MKNTITKHILIRIFLYVGLFFVAIPVGLSMLNPDRKCGTGDGLAVIFWQGVFYLIWAIFLLVEAFLLHRKGLRNKRNSNMIMVLALPILLALIALFFEIKEFID